MRKSILNRSWPSQGSAKLQIVDLVRSAAILTVMALHLKPTLFLSKEPWFQFVWDRFQRNGTYGVCIFFVVSGFLITQVLASGSRGLLRPNFIRFYSQRIGRIFPLYFVSIALGTMAYFSLNDHSAKFNYCFSLSDAASRSSFWTSLFFFLYNDWQYAWAPGVALGVHFLVLWSLSVEEQFYAVYPFLLGRMRAKSGLKILLTVVILLGLVWRTGVFFFHPGDLGLSTRVSFGAFDNIAVGALLYLLCEQYDPWLGRHRGTCLWICGGGFFLAWGIYFGTFSAEAFSQVYAPALLAFGVAAFLAGGRHLAIFESPLFTIASWPGKYCYGNYLFHIAVLYFFHSLFLRVHTALAFLIFVTISTSVAALSFHGFEMPVNRWIRRRFGGEKER